MNTDIRKNLSRSGIWLRLVFMIVLAFAFNVAEIIIFAMAVYQFLASLFTGAPNDQLIRFGRNMARYLQQVIAFLTFVTEEKPFPFAPWPDQPHEEVPEEDEIKQLTEELENTGDAAKTDKADEPAKANDTKAGEKPED